MQPANFAVASLAAVLATALLLVNDALQIRITFGSWALSSAPVTLLTLVAGLVVGVAVWCGWVLLAKLGTAAHRPTAIQIFVYSFALLYGVGTAFRLARVGFLRDLGGWAPPLVAMGLWVAVVFVLQRIGAATGRGWLGVFCAGLFLAFFLVGNRELIGRPTSLGALAFDAAGFAFSVVLVLLLRSRQPRDSRGDRVALAALATLSFLLATGVASEVAHRPGSLASSSASGMTSAATGSPHVVLIVFDTMRADVFEDVLVHTEEGREFADAFGPGTWFHQATAAGPWTAPSMSTVLTGLHPLQHQVRSQWSNRLSEDDLTLGEHLRRAGYQTLGVVANRALERSVGVDRGFQAYEGLPTADQLAVLGRLPHLFRRAGGPAGAPESWFVDARQARKVLQDRLRLTDPDQPVFLWYHLMDTHGPLKEHELAETPGDAGLTPTQRSYRNNARFALSETATALRAIYEHLPADNTLTIVLADHGEMLAADNQAAPGGDPDKPRTTGHGHAYHDTVVRVPLGIRLPGGQFPGVQRAVSERLVSHLDIVPTVVDVLARPWPDPLQGCSLVPLSTAATNGPEPEHCHPFVVSDGTGRSNPHSSLRTPRLKLMASPEDAFEPLLFDLEIDPYEQTDRAAEEPEATASALALLRSYWDQYTSDRPAAAGQLDPEQIETLRALGYLD